MNNKTRVDKIIDQVVMLNNNEIKHLHQYIEEKLQILNTSENSKLTQIEREFINSLMKAH